MTIHPINIGSIPPRILEALQRYIEYGCQPGGFVTAVLTNNLFDAAVRADDESLKALPEIARHIYNNFPAEAWGSEAIVKKWMNKTSNKVKQNGRDT